MADETETLAQRLKDLLPDDGALRGNKSLRIELGCSEDEYWAARDALLEAGEVAKGRGKGGSVRRVIVEADRDVEPEAEAEQVREVFAREKDLYAPMLDVVATTWSKERGGSGDGQELTRAQITGYQGRRRTGGVWSRPDLVCVRCNRWRHVPGPHMEVITFEVKPDGILDIRAVYEALAHRRVGTHAYALFHVPDGGASSEWVSILDEVVRVARLHGVGVVVADDPHDFDTWEELVEAERSEPDPATLEEFITTQLSPEIQAAIASWVAPA